MKLYPEKKDLFKTYLSFLFSQQLLATPEHYFIAKWVGVTEKVFKVQ